MILESSPYEKLFCLLLFLGVEMENCARVERGAGCHSPSTRATHSAGNYTLGYH